MNFAEIIKALDAEISTLQKAKSALLSMNGHKTRRKTTRKRGAMSAAGKAKIRAAQAKRWAAWRKAQKKAA